MSEKIIPIQKLRVCDGCHVTLEGMMTMHAASAKFCQSGSQSRQEREFSLDFCAACVQKIEEFIQNIPKKNMPPVKNWP